MRPYMAGALTLFVILTNNRMGWDAAIQSIAWDAASYEIIARAAPSMPQGQLLFHHAQRIFGPYLAGTLSKFTGLPHQAVFSFLTGICMSASIFFAHKSLISLGLSTWRYIVCISLFILNPYTLRYHMIAPGMLPDAMFTAGLAILMFGLIEKRFVAILTGVLIAALGRQTAMALIPGLALWVYAGKGWRDIAPLKKALCISSAASAIMSVYFTTGHIVSSFTSESINTEHLTGLFAYLAGPSVNAGSTFEFIVHTLVPYLVPFAVAAGISLRNRPLPRLPVEAGASLLFAAGIIAQPLLAGPDITRLEGGRLSSLGIIPMIMSISYLMRDSSPSKDGYMARLFQAILMTALLAGSLHFSHTAIGPGNFQHFAFTQIAASMAVCLAIYFTTAKYETVRGGP